MVERRLLRDWLSDAAALIDAVGALQARGAIWLNVRFREHEIMVEGWRRRPTGLGDRIAVKPGARPVVSTADFIERRLVRNFASELAAAENARDALRARGAAFMRVHIKPHGELVMEGWRAPPADQGDLPL